MDPDPHQSDQLAPDHINLQMASQNVWNISLLLEARLRIQLRIRINVKGRIQIRMKVISRIRIASGYASKQCGSATLRIAMLVVFSGALFLNPL
jgi:hypothetical protein